MNVLFELKVPPHGAIWRPMSCSLQVWSLFKTVWPYESTSREECRSRENTYKCKVCPKSFSHSNKLLLHLKTHKERLYKCELCPKRFLASRSLNAHQVFHTVGFV